MRKGQSTLLMNVEEPWCALHPMGGVLASVASANQTMLHSIIMATCFSSICNPRYTRLFVSASQQANTTYWRARVLLSLRAWLSMEMITSTYQMIMLMKLWSLNYYE